MSQNAGTAKNISHFKPVLSFGALLMFGVAFVGPTAPYTMFGIGTEKSHGHLALTYLIATVAMVFTAISFGRMANAHPSSGSSYAYASKEIHPMAGYFTGWSMILDYLFLPIISFIIIGVTANKLLPSVPYPVWVIGMAVIVTLLNLRGIEVTTKVTLFYNMLLLLSGTWFLIVVVRALLAGQGEGTLLSVKPFYNPATFNISAVMSASAICVLSFLGFDGVATLAEDAKNPRRDIPRATILTCLICGGSFVLLTYFGQLVWPDWTKFHPLDTAFSEIGGLVGGKGLFLTVAGLVLGQAFISAIASQASASRLLFGMAREGRLPAKIFCNLHPRFNTPHYSIMGIGAIAALIPLLMSLGQAAEMVNFGACIGFIGVNLSALLRAFKEWKQNQRSLLRVVPPFIGLVICLLIWITLSSMAMKLGFLWTFFGVLYLWVLTQGKFKLN